MPSPNLPSSEVHLKPKTLPGDPKTYRFKGSNPVIQGVITYYSVGFGVTGFPDPQKDSYLKVVGPKDSSF